MPDSTANQPIIFTDDAWIMSEESPITPDIIREKMIRPLEGMPAALWWAVGDHEVYHHETEIGEIVGDGYDLSELSEFERRKALNARHLTETAGGPVTVIASLCREAGIEFLPRFRMNSHYAYYAPPYTETYAPGYGRYRQENPHLLIGRPGESIPEGTIDWDIRTGKDYAYPEVRDYAYSIITELFERFDVDGVEMDFNRHPGVFRRDEAYQNRYLMTDLVRRVRKRLDEVGAERGRHLKLAVRVAPTLANSHRMGLDVSKWMADGLVDTVVAGVGWIPFEMPIAEFVEEARGTGCAVYGCLEGLRPLVDDNALRGAAYRYWEAGADGIYLYNYFTLPPSWIRRTLPELADPARLKRMSKRYEADHADRIQYGGHGGAFRNAVPAAQMPIALLETSTGRGPVVNIEVADDVESARDEGALGRCVLGVTIDNFAPGDEVDILLNGEVLPWGTGRETFVAGGRKWPTLEGTVSIQYDIDSPPLKQGVNEIEIRRKPPASDVGNQPVVTNVEITITYHGA